MLVVKDNALINASYNLDLVEQRLILLAIVEARDSGKGINAKDPLIIHAESYVNQFNVHRNTAYEALKSACENLFGRQFTYHSRNERNKIQIHKSRWVSEIIYIETEATVKLIFAPAIVPLITRLEEHFTSYELEQVAKLQSRYSTRLYEMLSAWRSTGKTPFFELQTFRSQLGLHNAEYSAMSDFKRNVLDKAVAQINKKSDLVVTYEQHKNGRTITGFSFKFKQKSQTKIVNKTDTKRDPNTADMFTNITDAQIAKYSTILCKLGSISDLSNFPDYPSFANWIAKILKDPESANPTHAKRIFKALRTETDFKG